MTDVLRSPRNAVMDGIGVAIHRKINGREARIPAGAVLVSTDNHLGLNKNIFYERAPAALRDRMPQIWWDDALGIWNMGIGRKPVFPPMHAPLMKSIEDRAGTFDVAPRMADMDADGVDKELVFAQNLPFYFQHTDFEAKEWIFRIHNEYLAELGQQAPGRFFGVGIPNYWDPSKARESIQDIKALGLKTYYLPVHPGVGISGKPIAYSGEEMDPFWEAAEEAGLPVCFHIGESVSFAGRGGVANTVFINLGPFRRNLGELIFGGILDRHPSLQIVFVEANLAWVPSALQDAEMIVDSFAYVVDPKPKLRPTEYWRRNCYATFTMDPVGMKLLDYIGTDRMMWATDYPHNEGTLGYTAETINAVVDAVSERDAKKILGGTAISVFDLA